MKKSYTQLDDWRDGRWIIMQDTNNFEQPVGPFPTKQDAEAWMNRYGDHVFDAPQVEVMRDPEGLAQSIDQDVEARLLDPRAE